MLFGLNRLVISALGKVSESGLLTPHSQKLEVCLGSTKNPWVCVPVKILLIMVKDLGELRADCNLCNELFNGTE